MSILKPYLISLRAEDITLCENCIVPEFSPEVNSYKFYVQNDIYGVKLFVDAQSGVKILINNTEVNPGGEMLIKLREDYESYSIDYSETVEIIAIGSEGKNTYKLEIIRENAKKVYDLFEPHVFEDTSTGIKMPYEIYLPANYSCQKKYPLVFVLHGAGQRLQSVDMVLKRYESATIWARDSEAGINECIVVSPQCAEANGTGWTYFMRYLDLGDKEAEAFKFTKWGVSAYNLLQKIKNEYSVDLKRIYLTGVSMGGFGTFEMAVEHTDEFAAIVPVCGGANPEKIEKLKGLPMWIFHAVDDPVVDYNMWCVPTIKALDKAGIEYKKTIYTEGRIFYPSGHFSWTPAYANKEMREWLFKQQRQ